MVSPLHLFLFLSTGALPNNISFVFTIFSIGSTTTKRPSERSLWLAHSLSLSLVPKQTLFFSFLVFSYPKIFDLSTCYKKKTYFFFQKKKDLFVSFVLSKRKRQFFLLEKKILISSPQIFTSKTKTFYINHFEYIPNWIIFFSQFERCIKHFSFSFIYFSYLFFLFYLSCFYIYWRISKKKIL